MPLTKAEELKLGSEMYACEGCRLYDPDTYTGPEVTYWTLRNGNYLEMQGMRLPLSSSFIPCVKHNAVLGAAGYEVTQ
jgi:hypothetical protein